MAILNDKLQSASWGGFRSLSAGDVSGAADLQRQIEAARMAVRQSLNPIGVAHERKNMIAMRLRGPVPFKNFETFLEGDKIYAAIVTSQGAVFLEDDAALFPSDTFMAQLRLLLP
jgi:hypothetical protein